MSTKQVHRLNTGVILHFILQDFNTKQLKISYFNSAAGVRIREYEYNSRIWPPVNMTDWPHKAKLYFLFYEIVNKQ